MIYALDIIYIYIYIYIWDLLIIFKYGMEAKLINT